MRDDQQLVSTAPLPPVAAGRRLKFAGVVSSVSLILVIASLVRWRSALISLRNVSSAAELAVLNALSASPSAVKPCATSVADTPCACAGDGAGAGLGAASTGRCGVDLPANLASTSVRVLKKPAAGSSAGVSGSSSIALSTAALNRFSGFCLRPLNGEASGCCAANASTSVPSDAGESVMPRPTRYACLVSANAESTSMLE